MTGSGLILPLAVILGAGVGTAVVWLSRVQQLLKMNELTNTIQALEQKVMSLETIGRGDKLDLQPKLETEA